MPTAAFHTLGCKVNQYETEKIREEMESLGFHTVPFPGPADVLLINSCTVTTTADGKSRAAIRKASGRNPDALVVATGCSVELDPLTFSCIEGVDVVVPNAEKTEIAERIAARFPDLRPNGSRSVRPRSRTRAIVKVQDGCDQFCTYCAIPFARSTPTSRPFGDVLSEIRSLAEVGYKEIVLTGIRLGSYGDERTGLPDLVCAVAEIDGIERTRLSSVEVWEVSPALIDCLAHPRVCPHLHVPLQSGDDGILKAMGRPYSVQMYAETIGAARKTVPDLAVTTDVMVGFPGETEAAFSATCEFVRQMAFSRLHVFRYSERPNTRAAVLSDQIPPGVKQRRSAELMALGERLSERFAEALVGKTVRVLVEKKQGQTGLLAGLTDNYVESEFAGPESLRGSIIDVHATSRRGSVLIGARATGGSQESARDES